MKVIARIQTAFADKFGITQVYADYNEQYQSFALIALFLLMIEFFIMSRKNHRLKQMDLFKENSNS